MIVDIAPEFGFVVAVVVALYLQQRVVFVVFVAKARSKFRLKPPIMYPRDSDVKNLKLSEAEVNEYLRAQRIHQNNLEFMSLFLPIYLVAGLSNPLQTALAGVWVFVFRMLYAFGYAKSSPARLLGGPYHFGECYVAYLAARFAYELIKNGAVLQRS